EPLETQVEGAPVHLVEQRSDVVRESVVHVADETQGEVIIFRVDPARAGQPAAQHGERLGNVGGNLEAGEQAGHGGNLGYATPQNVEIRRCGATVNVPHGRVRPVPPPAAGFSRR